MARKATSRSSRRFSLARGLRAHEPEANEPRAGSSSAFPRLTHGVRSRNARLTECINTTDLPNHRNPLHPTRILLHWQPPPLGRLSPPTFFSTTQPMQSTPPRLSQAPCQRFACIALAPISCVPLTRHLAALVRIVAQQAADKSAGGMARRCKMQTCSLQ